LCEPNVTASTKGSGTLFGSVYAGYNYVLSPGTLVGVEAALSFPNYIGADKHGSDPLPRAIAISQKRSNTCTIRGRMLPNQ
jgi:hypothetical protein